MDVRKNGRREGYAGRLTSITNATPPYRLHHYHLTKYGEIAELIGKLRKDFLANVFRGLRGDW
jgi:hypothetical protein